MRKKIFAFAAAVLIIASTAACGKGDDERTYADIETGQYKGIEVGESVATITDEELQDYIDYVMRQYSTTENLKEGTTKKDDKIVAVYKASQDGKDVSALSSSSSGATITLSEDGFIIDGFVDNLIGKNIGETVEFDVTIAEDSSLTDYRGQKVHYSVEIKELVVTTIPELTDEWAKEKYGYRGINNVEEFTEYQKNELYANTIYNAIKTKLVDGVTVNSYDSEELKKQTDSAKQQFEGYLSSMSIPLDAYLQAMEKSEEDFNADMEKQAKEYLKEKMLMLKIAELENITVSSDEHSSYMIELARSAGLENESELMSYYEGTFSEEDYSYIMTADKVQKFIANNIKVVPDSESDITEAQTTEKETTTGDQETTTGEQGTGEQDTTTDEQNTAAIE